MAGIFQQMIQNIRSYHQFQHKIGTGLAKCATSSTNLGSEGHHLSSDDHFVLITHELSGNIHAHLAPTVISRVISQIEHTLTIPHNYQSPIGFVITIVNFSLTQPNLPDT